jgi:hypothetical protein
MKAVNMPGAPSGSGFWYNTPIGAVIVCAWSGCRYQIGAKNAKDAEYEFEKHVRGEHMRHSRDNYVLARRALARLGNTPPSTPTVTTPPAPKAVRRSHFIPRKVA